MLGKLRFVAVVELKKISGVKLQEFSIGPPVRTGWVGAISSHTKSARMGEGSGSPGPHGDYL